MFQLFLVLFLIFRSFRQFIFSIHLSFSSIMSLTFPSFLLITCPYHHNLASLIFSAISTTRLLHNIWSLHSIMSLTSSPSFLLITCSYHLNLASLIFSAISTTPHLLISSFHNVSDQLSFISSFYMFIPSQPWHLASLTFSARFTTLSYLFIP